MGHPFSSLSMLPEMQPQVLRLPSVALGVADGLCGGLHVVGVFGAQDAVDHEFKPEDADDGDDRLGEEEFDAWQVVEIARAVKCAEDSSDECDDGRDHKYPLIAWCGSRRSLRMRGSGGFGLAEEPYQNHDGADDGADVLEERVVLHRSYDRKKKRVAQKTPMAVRPIASVGEAVPEHVRPDSNHYGKQKECEVADVLGGQGAWTECHSLAEAFRHPAPERFLCIAVKEPEGQNGERKVEREDPGPCMAESMYGVKCQEKEKIRRETANDDGGRYKTRAPKREGCCCMSEGKRHPKRFDAMVPRSGARDQLPVNRKRLNG